MNPATRLLAVAADPQQAARARAGGADLIDVSTATPGALASIEAILPSAVLWTGPAGHGATQAQPFDADQQASAARQPPGSNSLAGPPLASVIAAVAIGTWLGRPVIRSRHTQAARRAIDMTLAIAGRRPPACTIRGLA